MTYDQQDKFKELLSLVSSYTNDRVTNHNDQDAIEANLKWNASLFIAKAIYLAEPIENDLSIGEFIKFYKDYEDTNGKVDSDSLFERHWLRNVLGKVQIAGIVSSACSTFSKIASLKNELIFLYEELPERSKQYKILTKKEFEAIKHEFEKRNNLTLNDESLYREKLLSESDGEINISKINYYYKPYLDHWGDFEFLTEYKSKISLANDRNQLKIKKEQFQSLHGAFDGFYRNVPSIENFINQNLIIEENELYYLNLQRIKIDYWSTLKDHIIAYYWQLLIEDNSLSNDEERVKRLLQQLPHWKLATGFLKYSIIETKKRFLDAAFNIVCHEADLDIVESEFTKVSIDRRFISSEVQSLFQDHTAIENVSLNNSDHFELLESFENWESTAATTYLYDQSSRDELSFLIKAIVAYDFETEKEEFDNGESPVIHNFKRIFALLEQSLTKPNLLWDIKCYVLMCRRIVIPYLLRNVKYTSLAFKFIDQLEEYLLDKKTIQKRIWIKAVELALYLIRNIYEQIDAPKLVCQIFRQLNSNKYQTSYYQQNSTEKFTQKQKEEKEKAVLSLIENSSLYNHKVHGDAHQFLFPQLFNRLTVLFINMPSKPLYNNGAISFPMLQWDGITWLMKCHTYWKYQNQFQRLPPDIDKLSDSFFKLYIDRIEVTKVRQYNFFQKKEEKGLPRWSEKIERLEHIEWIYPVYRFYIQQKLNSFLEPRIYFEFTSDYYNKFNQFSADKLRTHIGVLLQVLRQFVMPTIPYGLEKEQIQEIKLRIESQIIDYLKKHIKSVPEKGRVDLFNYNREWAFNNSEKEALLPQVARALNWFSKKEEVIELMLENKDVIKILTVAKWVTSDGIKQRLIEQIKQSDIQSFLASKLWAPEIHQILLDISGYPELINEINQVVEFWEERVLKKDRKYEVPLYQTKMLLAYFQRDERELSNIKKPSLSIHGVNELSYHDHKEFYRALIQLEKNPESSHGIFSQLSTRYPQYSVFAVNQMAAKIEIAKATSDLKNYKEALEEWNAYRIQQGELDEKQLGSTFSINMLHILLKLGEHNKLDSVYAELEMPYQMIPDILDSKIESLIERKRIEEASILLEKAENFHQFSGDGDNEFIKTMQDKIGGVDNLQILNSYYTKIFTSPPSKLIKIFPADLNGQKSLQSFLVSEIASAAKMMLDKVVSISDIKGEDKYNDVLEIVLNSKMNPWGWFVTDQARGGYSDSEYKSEKKQPGERDFKFFNKKDTFGICEAFIYRTPAPAKKHLKKVFNYYHQRDSLIILIYDLNGPYEATKNWENYLKSVVPTTDFPKGNEYIQYEDLSNSFELFKSAIRIAKSMHKGDLSIYHIFVNVNYKYE